MRASATASRHQRSIVGAERLTHTASSPATIALHFHIQGFAAGPDFVEVQQAFALCRSLMDEFHPREVIEMAMFTRHHETGGNHERGSALRRAIVDVASSVGAVRINFWLEQPGANRSQQPALRT